MIEELGRFARGEAFDEQPMPGLDSEVLDFRAASESFDLSRSQFSAFRARSIDAVSPRDRPDVQRERQAGRAEGCGARGMP